MLTCAIPMLAHNKGVDPLLSRDAVAADMTAAAAGAAADVAAADAAHARVVADAATRAAAAVGAAEGAAAGSGHLDRTSCWLKRTLFIFYYYIIILLYSCRGCSVRVLSHCVRVRACVLVIKSMKVKLETFDILD